MCIRDSCKHIQSLLDLERAAGIRVRGDGKPNDRYTGGFRRWPYGEGDGGRASSGCTQNSKKNACVWHMQVMQRTRCALTHPAAAQARGCVRGATEPKCMQLSRTSSSSAREVMVPHCTEPRDGHTSRGEHPLPLVTGVVTNTLVQRVVMGRTVRKLSLIHI